MEPTGNRMWNLAGTYLTAKEGTLGLITRKRI
jgi:hypothetical protein